MSAATSSRTVSTIVRCAARQALIDLRIQLLSPMLLSWLMMPGLGLLILFFMRGADVDGTTVSVGQHGIAGVLTMTLVTAGFLGVAGQLILEREDGTLLRAKSIPHGIPSQLLGDVLVNCGTALGPLVVLLIPSALFFDGVAPESGRQWAAFAVFSVLGLLATLPLGAVLGALIKNTSLLWMVGMAVYVMLAISGVFYPITALPGWLQTVGTVMPTYWIGHGLRFALLPEEAVVLELGGQWHLTLAAVVLLVWAVVGFALAVPALRAMARRQTGSALFEARERLLARGY